MIVTFHLFTTIRFFKKIEWSPHTMIAYSATVAVVSDRQQSSEKERNFFVQKMLYKSMFQCAIVGQGYAMQLPNYHGHL